MHSFLSLLGSRVLVFDGAMGTMLQAAGLPPGGCPEVWNVERPDVVAGVHRAYVDAGAHIVETNTFGGNRVKLRHYGLERRVGEINGQAVSLARQAVGDRALVAASLGPTGLFVEPLGDMTFQEAYDVFAEQAEACAAAGADLFIVETMADLGEARAAVMAAKERTGLPVVAQLTFAEGGRTFTGTDPETAVLVLASAGADVVGANCSVGPAELLGVVERMADVGRVPVSVQPNAGLPRLVGGTETVFPLGPEEFASWGPRLVAAGASLVGGCCGTTPEHIRLLAGAVGGLAPPWPARRLPRTSGLASRTRCLWLVEERLPVLVGERINPTGRKRLQADVAEGSMVLVRQEARQQAAAGAHVLDVNVGVPGIDEAAAMRLAVLAVQEAADLPLCLDSSTPSALEAGLRATVGKPLVNSASGETGRLEAVLPLARRFGAGLIFLALDDGGIPATAEGRLAVARRLARAAEEAGFPREDVYVDCLAMAVGADQASARETLRAIALVKKELGLRTILGLSNISFGMPHRRLLNATFLAMALAAGLDAVILNPLDEGLVDTVRAARVILRRDPDAREYVAVMGARPEQPRPSPAPPALPGGQTDLGRKRPAEVATAAPGPTEEAPPSPGGARQPEPAPPARDPLDEALYRAVLEGDPPGIVPLVEQALAAGRDPLALLNEVLIPAIEEVGRLFGEGIYFLPQLILSANAMKAAFERLKPELARRQAGEPVATIVMATVEGDIHDIGKNICCVLLENHGFRVVDLGRDVPAERILEAARREGADIVGLSALMTTTMPRMKEVVDLFRREGLNIPIIIGGAATDKAFAREIGASGHGADAAEAVQVAKRVLGLVFPEARAVHPAGQAATGRRHPAPGGAPAPPAPGSPERS